MKLHKPDLTTSLILAGALAMYVGGFNFGLLMLNVAVVVLPRNLKPVITF